MEQKILLHDEKCGNFYVKIPLLWKKLKLEVRYFIEVSHSFEKGKTTIFKLM